MKKSLLLLVLAIMFVGCGDEIAREEIRRQENTIKPSESIGLIYNTDIYVFVVDSCEYIGSYTGYVLTHKGNCKNPIHIKNGNR